MRHLFIFVVISLFLFLFSAFFFSFSLSNLCHHHCQIVRCCFSVSLFTQYRRARESNNMQTKKNLQLVRLKCYLLLKLDILSLLFLYIKATFKLFFFSFFARFNLMAERGKIRAFFMKNP